MDDLIVVKAKIKVLTEEEGGRRKTGIANYYRPNHVFELPDNGHFITYAGEINSSDGELIYPGDEKNVEVRFLRNETIEKYLVKGCRWWIYEVPNLIAEAEILSVL